MITELLETYNAQFFVQYASSRDANFFYSTGFKVHDPVLYVLGSDGTDLLVVPDMEKGRAERESRVREIAGLGDIGYYENLRYYKDPRTALAQTYLELLLSHGARKILVPTNFPSFLSFYLIKQLEVEVVENPFSKMRAVKRRDEIEKIKEVAEIAIKAFEHGLNFIKARKKCEVVRSEIETYLYSKKYLAEDTIVSSGKLSADPHHIGMGEIEKHVVMDIFPKSRVHGYHADFTRTVLLEDFKEIEEMLEACIEAKNRAIKTVRDGVFASEVHQTVCDILEDHGYHTLRHKAGEGFIHSTGHGIGLEVHELPRIFESGEKLKAGMVFTIEPGLYYRKWGGVRVEDTVVVKKNGCEVLTPYPDKVDLR
jgi:Xaa-Pro aminopeptidase